MSEVTQFCRGQSVFRTISSITNPIKKIHIHPLVLLTRLVFLDLAPEGGGEAGRLHGGHELAVEAVDVPDGRLQDLDLKSSQNQH